LYQAALSQSGCWRMNIRVLLVDDHQVMRDALRWMLEHELDIEVVGEAEDGWAMLEILPALHPDVVVMDVSMPRMNGIEATQRLLENYPLIKVIGLSSFDVNLYAQKMLDVGASAYISKMEAANELPHALRAVMSDAKIPDIRAALDSTRFQ
jgi:DNA-binding NarL/FixJ family response regulator